MYSISVTVIASAGKSDVKLWKKPARRLRWWSTLGGMERWMVVVDGSERYSRVQAASMAWTQVGNVLESREGVEG